MALAVLEYWCEVNPLRCVVIVTRAAELCSVEEDRVERKKLADLRLGRHGSDCTFHVKPERIEMVTNRIGIALWIPEYR